MADPHDSGRQAGEAGTASRTGRIPPMVGLPGETVGEAVARALQQKNLARQRAAAANGDTSEQAATTEDSDAT